MAADEAPTVEEALAWEARRRVLAAAAAIAAGVAFIAGTVVGGLALRNRPSVTLPDALHDAANPTTSNGLLTKTAHFVHGHAVGLTAGQALLAIAAPLSALALIYLFRAIRARNPVLGQAALVALGIGAVASFVGLLASQIAIDVSTAHFVTKANPNTITAHDALQPSGALTASLIGFVGHVALGVGFVLVALNAMRVGLLTRFMGVLGIMAGVFLAFPFFSVPIVQAFWLVALGGLILGRWPNGMPPAWASGRAEPWPSRQDVVEARGQARQPPSRRREAGLPPPSAEPIPADPERPAQARSKKKKRRRR